MRVYRGEGIYVYTGCLFAESSPYYNWNLLSLMFRAFLHESIDILCMLYVCFIQPRVVRSAPRQREMSIPSPMQCCTQQPLNTSKAPTHQLNSMTLRTCHLLHIRYHWEWYILYISSVEPNYAHNYRASPTRIDTVRDTWWFVEEVTL